MKNNNVWKALKKSRSSYSWISTQMFGKIQLSWASCGKKVEEFRAWQCKFFSKGSLDSYSHFLFYAWLGISELRGPGFCWAQKGPETQLKEIKKGVRQNMRSEIRSIVWSSSTTKDEIHRFEEEISSFKIQAIFQADDPTVVCLAAAVSNIPRGIPSMEFDESYSS